MQSLERRIAELEKAGSTGGDPLIIVIRGVSPGRLDEEIQKLHTCDDSQQ